MGDKYYKLENYKDAPQKIKDNFFWTKDELINYYGNENEPTRTPPKEFMTFLKDKENHPYFCACFECPETAYSLWIFKNENGTYEKFKKTEEFKKNECGKEKLYEFVFQYNSKTDRVERIHKEDDWDFINWHKNDFITSANCDYVLNWNGESSGEIEVLYFVFQHLHFCNLTEYDFEEWMNL